MDIMTAVESILSREYDPMRKLDTFTAAYVETALWAETDDDGVPFDRDYTIDDIAPETLDRMVADCGAFQDAHWDLVSYGLARAGHDFWLTRNRHGAGFWDGDWEHSAQLSPSHYIDNVGDYLTDKAHAFGEVHLYVGDDGYIYAY